LPFVYVASHTALRAPCTAFAQAAPKRDVITRHILTRNEPCPVEHCALWSDRRFLRL
jgi:hypothetical protein